MSGHAQEQQKQLPGLGRQVMLCRCPNNFETSWMGHGPQVTEER